jgi:tetratricopeptide (TPR) repeat protein
MTWAHAELGEALRSAQRYEDSVAAFDRALEQKPDYVFALGGKGESLRLLGRIDDAMAVLDRAIELEPTYAFGLRVLGQIKKVRQEFPEALAIVERLDQAVATDGDRAYAQAERGELLRLLGRYPESLAAFQRAAEMDPAYVYALGGMGETLRLLGKYEEAIAALDKAVALDPKYGFGLGIRGRIWADGADYAEAVELLSRALELEESWAWAMAAKALALRYSGAQHLREARELFAKVVELEPDSLEYRVLLADVLRRLGAGEEARAEYARVAAAESQPERLASNPNLRAAVGWSLLFLERADEGVRHLIDAVASGSDMTEAQLSLGLALTRQGRPTLALSEYERGLTMAQALHPLRRRGVLFEALQDLREGCEETPAIADVEETKKALELLAASFEAVRQTVH